MFEIIVASYYYYCYNFYYYYGRLYTITGRDLASDTRLQRNVDDLRTTAGCGLDV